MNKSNIEDIRSFMTQLSEEDIRQINIKEHEKYEDEYKRFIEAYDNGICYLCGKHLRL